MRSADVNAYLREIGGIEISAKDFRTWNGTVVAAVALAVDELGARDGRSATARKRAVPAAIREVADYLGNTPSVARASYVDPRVVDLFIDGTTIAPTLDGAAPDLDDRTVRDRIEVAVLDLLR